VTRILIVDDRPINCQFLTTLLSAAGFETREATNGFDALDIARAWTPELAIVDIVMPVMDGIELVRRLRADGFQSTGVIFYTASYEASEARGLTSEFQPCQILMKPSEPEVILQTVDRALGKKQTRSRAELSEKAAAEYLRVHAEAMLTAALLDFQLEIAEQQSPEAIFDVLRHAAQEITPSEYCSITIRGGDDPSDALRRSSQYTASLHCPEHLDRLMRDGRTVRTTKPVQCNACALSKVTAASYLGVPLATSRRRYGWLCLINRQGAGEYSMEDERIATTLAAQAATAYENLLLYEKLREEANLLDRNVNLLRATIEASGDGIAVVDRDSHFVTYNRHFVEIWGLPEEVLASGDGLQSLEVICAQLKNPEALRADARAAIAGTAVNTTWEMKDGRVIEGHGASRLFEGATIGRVWSFRDVTERIQAEEALRKSEEKYRSLIAHIPEVTWTADGHGNLTFISTNIEAIYGFSAEEVYASGETLWLDRVHPDDRDRVQAGYAALFAGGKGFKDEFRIQRKDGVWIWVHAWSLGTYEYDGDLNADGVLRDITARKAAESEFRRVARDRELLLESTVDGIYAVDNRGRCTMANRAAAVFLGRTIDELIGCQVHELIHHHKADGSPYPVEECAICRAFHAGKASRATDEVFWRNEGTSFPVEYLSSPLIDDGVVRGAVVTFSDVTERRKLERRLEQVSRVSSLGRMAATIAHEFNNVLMGIQPFAEIMRRRAGDDPKMQQAAGQILNSVTRGKNITQDILRMTRPPEPALHSIDVSQWLNQLAAEIRPQVGSQIAVTVEVPAPGTLFALCDPAQMQQVVMNLAFNARDAMNAGGTLTLSAARGDMVRVVVADTGCGMDAETLPFIFEPLFTTKKSGTGLGLAVAQQLVIRNGGTIAVESTPGVGTRFKIELPEALPSVQRLLDEPLLSPDQFGVRRVLIVEDDRSVASGLASILESEKVQVRVVVRGGEAVGAIAAFDPDVVLIDIGLPDMSGTAVYEQIAARWPRMSVIFSTGHADEARFPYPGLKHVGFLRKPYSTETLLNKIREVV
jgi:PAS domain S-box-containing protein